MEDHEFDSEMVEIVVFFFCDEALQNARKHAGTYRSVAVHLSEVDGWVQFNVEDDGGEFDPQTVARGLELDSMHERVIAVGGSVPFDSAAGHGTRVRGSLPADA